MIGGAFVSPAVSGAGFVAGLRLVAGAGVGLVAPSGALRVSEKAVGVPAPGCIRQLT